MREEHDGQVVVCSANRIVTLRPDFQMSSNRNIEDPITCGLIVGDYLIIGCSIREKIHIFDRHTLEIIKEMKYNRNSF
jgi:hypothetical protein